MTREASAGRWRVPEPDDLGDRWVRVTGPGDTTIRVGSLVIKNPDFRSALLLGSAVVALVVSLATLNVVGAVISALFLALISAFPLHYSDGLYLSRRGVRLRFNVRPLDIPWSAVDHFDLVPAPRLRDDETIEVALRDGRTFECRDFTRSGLGAKVSMTKSSDLLDLADRLTLLASEMHELGSDGEAVPGRVPPGAEPTSSVFIATVVLVSVLTVLVIGLGTVGLVPTLATLAVLGLAAGAAVVWRLRSPADQQRV